MKKVYINKRKLAEYNRLLSERNKAVLYSLKLCGFLKTDQIKRLHFSGLHISVAHRSLVKLHGLGLIQPLKRRIGGVRAGSSSYVWALKNAGLELLQLNMQEPMKKRKRVLEPTYIFLKHTLEIAELYTRLRTTKKLVQVEFEPDCWRSYTTHFGVNAVLKPDLYAVTAVDGFEDYWFFEVDLDTEAPSRIIGKCESYGKYYLTEIEQNRNKVFPRVVWIVPDKKRESALKRHIAENMSGYAGLFAVTTFEGLDRLIKNDKEIV